MGVSISKLEKCTLSKTREAYKLFIWLVRWMEKEQFWRVLL